MTMNIVISIMTKGKDHPPHHIDWFKQTPPYDQVEQITHESTANLRNNDVDDYTDQGDNLMMLLTQIEPSCAQSPIYITLPQRLPILPNPHNPLIASRCYTRPETPECTFVRRAPFFKFKATKILKVLMVWLNKVCGWLKEILQFPVNLKIQVC